MEFPGQPLIFILGPTAVGKTRLAVALARQFNGEIVNADSRQVYRHMDIGTAKPTLDERRNAPHHLLDLLDPDQDFGLASFLSHAENSIRDILGRGCLPIVAGGTGQYIWALAEGWQVPKVPPDAEFRREKRREAEQHGPMFVYQQLRESDPSRAVQLDSRNIRRVIRALEVHQHNAQNPQEKSPPPSAQLFLGLTMDRRALYQRVDERVDNMLAAGLLDEVEGLEAMGYPLGQGPLASPGYKELGQYLASEMNLDDAAQRTKYRTHRMVRRQYTWFKPDDERIHWLDAADPGLETTAASLVRSYLKSLPAVLQ